MQGPTRIALRVVTLPPSLAGIEAARFADAAQRGGADALEIRNDLHEKFPIEEGIALPMLLSERGKALSAEWTKRATWIDRETPASDVAPNVILSHHAKLPMSTEEAVRHWRTLPHPSAHAIKHVEPLGSPEDAARLLVTQKKLGELVGEGKVTVLATGPLALPFRAVLAERNAFDYVAASSEWSAAPGQRLLADAARCGGSTHTDERRARLGIIGARIAHSRSPRIHPQPFDRIDLPEDVDLTPFLKALLPHYRGLAVTSPFKQRAALAVGASLAAVNTLARGKDGWRAANTDVAGAHAVLRTLDAKHVTILGDGGVTPAILEGARDLRIETTLLRREATKGIALQGTLLWTWPPHVEAPEDLELQGATVAVIAYGPPAKSVVRQILARGGVPVRLGPRWFIAQARAQRSFWEAA